MSYHKRIILDFDDTLAFHENRDWANSKPNKRLIDKTNRLYDDGWTIDIFTARGSLSCATRQEAAAKYQPGMEEWLAKNGVKYHSISFDKPLAAYYIDDKGMHPDEFLNVSIQKLEGGLSGSDIYTDGKLVHKQDKNAHLVHRWYKQAEGVNTPRIERVVGETITMEYIPHDKKFFEKNLYVALGLIQQTLETLKKNTHVDDLTWDSYVARIKDHVLASNQPYFSDVTQKLNWFRLKRTFSHGDFGITNMLFHENHLFMIDPIPNVFGCVELDAAKFIASLVINKYPEDVVETSKRAMITYNNIDYADFHVLIASEIIRVYKYHPDKQFILECVHNVFR